MPWLWAPSESWRDGSVLLPGDEHHHASRVLRLRVGQEVVVTDGRGRSSPGRLMGDTVEVTDVSLQERSRPGLHVFQAAAKAGKTDEILEKLGELGIDAFSVFASERTIARWDQKRAARITERWSSIARRAGKQSRQSRFVEIEPPLSWSTLIERIGAKEASVVLWEGAEERLRHALPDHPGEIALIVGPEGGFSGGEIRDLEGAGATAVSLGPGIIRSENAAFLAAALCLSAYGRIG